MKKFIIMGNLNSLNYKEVFPELMTGKIWPGVSITTGARWFNVPDDYVLKEQDARMMNGQKQIRISGVRWITNVSVLKEPSLELTEVYQNNIYKKFDGYDAINVDRLKEIPYDYDGLMGVPITVMDKIWSDGLIHFKNAVYKMIGVMNSGTSAEYDMAQPKIEGKVKFKRILMKKLI